MKSAIRSVSAILAAAGSCAGVQAASIASVLPTQAITEPASDERVGAGLATVDVTGIPSWDALGSPNNVVRYLWVGPFNEVNGVGLDVVLQTVTPTSWRSEIKIRVTNAGGVGSINLTPGGGDNSPGGPTHYSTNGQILKLANYGIPNTVALADGYIRLEFYDSYDDAPGEIDGLWVSGTVQFQTHFAIPPVPATGTSGLLAIAGIAILRRRPR
ncbi:MAG: hypothetical protein JNK58_03705 [Phycisphaerae bacterium]|nr:hypothetical protein [Phycisphaerae bacterium]